MRAYRTRNSGFTLVEILIVVIILGILAAIVIPQFTNASQDARKSSLTSQLQTIRSQVELFKLQHRDTYPTSTGTLAGNWDWSLLTTKTDADRAASAAADAFGPYLQAAPVNPIVSATGVDATLMSPVANDAAGAAGSTVTAGGWIFSQTTGKVWATTKSGTKVYNEADPSDANNDL